MYLFGARPNQAVVNGTLRDIRIDASMSHTPTLAPTTYKPSGPSYAPSPYPSPFPSFEPLCCLNQDHISNNTWKTCQSASDPSLGVVETCGQCAAYGCLDWTVGSSFLKREEEDFYTEENEDVQVDLNPLTYIILFLLVRNLFFRRINFYLVTPIIFTFHFVSLCDSLLLVRME